MHSFEIVACKSKPLIWINEVIFMHMFKFSIKRMHSLGIICLAQAGRAGLSRLTILIQRGGIELSSIHEQCNESVGMGFTHKLKRKCALSEFLNTSSCP